MLPPKVFVSAVSSEFADARKIVVEVLTREGFEPVEQKLLGTNAGEISRMLRDRIDGCDAVIHIAGDVSGFGPKEPDPEYGRCSYTQLEARHAEARGLPVYYIVPEDRFPRDVDKEYGLDACDDPEVLKVARNVATVRREGRAARDDSPRGLDRARRRAERQSRHKESILAGDKIYYRPGDHAELRVCIHELKPRLEELRVEARRWFGGVYAGLAAVLLCTLAGLWFSFGLRRDVETGVIERAVLSGDVRVIRARLAETTDLRGEGLRTAVLSALDDKYELKPGTFAEKLPAVVESVLRDPDLAGEEAENGRFASDFLVGRLPSRDGGGVGDGGPEPSPVEEVDRLERVARSVFTLEAEGPDGTERGRAFLVDEAGLIATNAHVIGDAQGMRVEFFDGSTADVIGVLASDDDADAAILQIPRESIPDGVEPLELKSRLPLLNADVLAVAGEGAGGDGEAASVAIDGAVEAFLNGQQTIEVGGTLAPDVRVIQTSAKTEAGVSGAPLIDPADYSVIGVMTYAIEDLGGGPDGRAGRGATGSLAITAESIAALLERSRSSSPVSPYEFWEERHPQDERDVMTVRVMRSLDDLKPLVAARWRSHLAKMAARARQRGRLLESRTNMVTHDQRVKQEFLDRVRKGGKEGADAFEEFPFDIKRSRWVRHAREYIATRERLILELRREQRELLGRIERGAFPPPPLDLRDPSPGDIGVPVSLVATTDVFTDHVFRARDMSGTEVLVINFVTDRFAGHEFRVNDIFVVMEPDRFRDAIPEFGDTPVLMPLMDDQLPGELKRSVKTFLSDLHLSRERDADLWARRREQNREIVDSGGPLPLIGIENEPRICVDYLRERTSLRPPNVPSEFRKVTTRVPIVLPGPGGKKVRSFKETTRSVETDFSKYRKMVARKLYEVNCEAYHSFMVRNLIYELRRLVRVVDGDDGYNAALMRDLANFERNAFAAFGTDLDDEGVISAEIVRNMLSERATQKFAIFETYGSLTPPPPPPPGTRERAKFRELNLEGRAPTWDEVAPRWDAPKRIALARELTELAIKFGVAIEEETGSVAVVGDDGMGSETTPSGSGDGGDALSDREVERIVAKIRRERALRAKRAADGRPTIRHDRAIEDLKDQLVAAGLDVDELLER